MDAAKHTNLSQIDKEMTLATKAGWWAGCVRAAQKWSYLSLSDADIEQTCHRMLEEDILRTGMGLEVTADYHEYGTTDPPKETPMRAREDHYGK